jgi:uncharacterized protein YndB with AHSA1/START domain
MENRSVTHCTFVIERTYGSAPERVFSAFSDPVKKRRWFVEGEKRDVLEFEMDFRVGGREVIRSRFKEGTLFPGAELVNHTTYQDVVPNQRIVLAYTMSMGDRRFSASLATLEFLPAEKGTLVIFTDQGAFFEGADGPKIREEGWSKLLEQLAKELDSQPR